MNFDDIKSNWDQENSGNIQIPESVSELKKAQHPIDKLKRNMRLELILQVITLLILPFYFRIHLSGDLQDVLLGVYAVFLLICIYYTYHFYLFYKKSMAYSGASRDSLYELYYSLRLNMERYRSFGFLLLPFVMLLAGLSSLEHVENLSLEWQEILVRLKSLLMSMVVLAVIFIGTVILWVDRLYGKYARQIKDALDELKEENQA